jgi:hypothetical protein
VLAPNRDRNRMVVILSMVFDMSGMFNGIFRKCSAFNAIQPIFLFNIRFADESKAQYSDLMFTLANPQCKPLQLDCYLHHDSTEQKKYSALL